MLKQRGKQLLALDSQMCQQEEDHHLLDQSVNIHQDQAANSQQTQATNLQEKTEHMKKKIKIAELIAETEFMEKKQTLEQQAQRFKIATEVAKLETHVKLEGNTREFIG